MSSEPEAVVGGLIEGGPGSDTGSLRSRPHMKAVNKSGLTMFTLKQVESTDEIEQTRQLFHEYVTWLGVNLCFQNYDKEVAELPGEYVPPTGRLYLACENDEIAGCIALRKLGDGICEMKRLYVRPQFRGKRLGRNLVDRILEDARQIGYRRMRLDTLPGKMDAAIGMYRSLGFKDIERYYDNPYETAAFMELDLATARGSSPTVREGV